MRRSGILLVMFVRTQNSIQNANCPCMSEVCKFLLMSVPLWSFLFSGSKLVRFLAKNQHNQRNLLYFVNPNHDDGSTTKDF